MNYENSLFITTWIFWFKEWKWMILIHDNSKIQRGHFGGVMSEITTCNIRQTSCCCLDLGREHPPPDRITIPRRLRHPWRHANLTWHGVTIIVTTVPLVSGSGWSRVTAPHRLRWTSQYSCKLGDELLGLVSGRELTNWANPLDAKVR